MSLHEDIQTVSEDLGFACRGRLTGRLTGVEGGGDRGTLEDGPMNTPKKLRVPDLALMKQRGERIVMLTAYDATMARLFDRAGIDMLLVGDSLGHVILGLETTIPVTLEAMIHHTVAVTRGARRALVVADMPFLTYQISP